MLRSVIFPEPWKGISGQQASKVSHFKQKLPVFRRCVALMVFSKWLGYARSILSKKIGNIHRHFPLKICVSKSLVGLIVSEPAFWLEKPGVA